MAIRAAVPMEAASAPRASALATSAPERMPPATMSFTSRRCTPSSLRARTDSPMAATVGMPTCSMNTSWVAAVPPCMPSTTTASAPAFTASAVS